MTGRNRSGRTLRGALALAIATSLVLVLVGPAEAGSNRVVDVWFQRSGEPVAATRHAPTIMRTVQALLAGPTHAERRRGLRSAIPAGTKLRELSIARRIVTVDLSARFAAGRTDRAPSGRIGQLVRTVRGIPGVRAVRVRIEGGTPIGLFPGYDLRRPVFTAPSASRAPGIRELQQLLVDLGFSSDSGVTGVFDPRTATAVLGFQKWVGLPRDGELGDETISALLRATRPQPARRAGGRRIEVHLGRQLALLVSEHRVLRTVHISTGAAGATPVGSYRVFRKERYSWSVPFQVWLPWASYFTGGIAFHEYPDVPTYPASHGCVRVNGFDATTLYAFASSGTPVDVFYESA